MILNQFTADSTKPLPIRAVKSCWGFFATRSDAAGKPQMNTNGDALGGRSVRITKFNLCPSAFICGFD
jgi:hypothetical protein